MSHPWEEISLDDYERHMRLASVGQLQALNAVMKKQFEAYPVQTAMVLGAAGGNGLEHVRQNKYSAVYGVDINKAYLQAAEERYPRLRGILKCLCLDLTAEAVKLPRAELIIADLLIEYIGYDAFLQVILQTCPYYVSCVIQVNADETEWISDSPYLHVFDRLDGIHHRMEADKLTAAMNHLGYPEILRETTDLPNRKQLVRLDYRKVSP